MKAWILLPIVVVSLFAACSRQAPPSVASATPEPEPIATPAPETPAPATPSPVAMVTPTPIPATPEPNYFAPDGIYYLLVKKSVETPDALIGLRPGTQLVREADGRYRVEVAGAGEQRITLAAHEVTNDLRIVQQLVANDAAATAVLRQQMDQRAAGEQEARRLQYATPAAVPVAPTPRRVASRRAEPTPGPTPANPLERGAFGQTTAFDKPFSVRPGATARPRKP